MAIPSQITPAQRALLVVLDAIFDADGNATFDEVAGTVRSTYALLEAYSPTQDGSIGAVGERLFAYKSAHWYPAGIGSPVILNLTPEGTAAANGLVLEREYARAATLTPHGSALSATNRARVVLNGGDWTLSQVLQLVNHVDIEGRFGARIITENGDLGAGAGSKIFYQNATNTGVYGLRFISSDNTAMFGLAGALVGFTHKDLRFEASTSAMPSISIMADSTTVTSSRIENVWTNGIGLYTCDQLLAPATLASGSEFVDCTGGNYSYFGNSFGEIQESETYAGKINGRLLRCEMSGTASGIRIGATGIVEKCKWAAPITSLAAGATFMFSEVAPTTALASISNHLEGIGPGVVARAIKVANCILNDTDNTVSGATHKGLGASITNDLGATTHGNSFWV